MGVEAAAGDVWRMRRRHPCGGWEWRVVRVGADVGIVCLTCGRRATLARRRFEARAKTRVSAAPGPP